MAAAVTGLLPENVDYTDKDMSALRVRLRALIKSVFPTWSDFNVANFGNILVELVCWNLDVLGLYQDNQAREAFIGLVTQRKNIVNLAKLIGYTPASAVAAQAIETFTLSQVPTADVVLASGRTLRTAEVTEPIVFQLTETVTIAAGTDPPVATGVVEHSTAFEQVLIATELPNQEVRLEASPYLDGSAVVIAGNGVYAQVDDFLASTAGDRHYTISVDQIGRATFRFGNGVNGQVPYGTITFAMKIGGGVDGNVDPNTIVKLDERVIDVLGNEVAISVTNVEAPFRKGLDRPSVEAIRIAAPRSLRVLGRTVCREDYEINALKVPGVARALMTTSNEDPGVQENHGILYIVPSGGGTPSQQMKDDVRTMCTVTYPNTVTFQLAVHDPIYLDLDFQMTVYKRAGVTAAQAGAAIRAALAQHLAVLNDDDTPNRTIDFGFYYQDEDGNSGDPLPLDDLFNVVRDLPQLRRMGDDISEFLVNGEHKDIVIATREFPRLGSVTITDGDTGALL